MAATNLASAALVALLFLGCHTPSSASDGMAPAPLRAVMDAHEDDGEVDSGVLDAGEASTALHAGDTRAFAGVLRVEMALQTPARDLKYTRRALTLHLDSPIDPTALANDSGLGCAPGETEVGIASRDDATETALIRLVGQRVVVRGLIACGSTAYHHRPVMLFDVELATSAASGSGR